MPITRIAIGAPGEASQPDAIKAALAEFFSMLIFVFAGEGSGMAFSKISNSNIFYLLIKIKFLFSCHYIFIIYVDNAFCYYLRDSFHNCVFL